MNIQSKLYNYLENPHSSTIGKYLQYAIFTNIVISISVLFLLSESSIAKEFREVLITINAVTMYLFLFEYILRQIAAGHNPKFKGFGGRIRYSLSPLMFFDLLVLLPFFLSFLGFDLNFLKSLRFIRIFKLFRVARFAEFDALIINIFRERKEEFIYILISSFFLLIVLSSIVYYFENPAQPEVFDSMFSTMWWAIITFTTVGYGDMYPVTAGGKVFTTITAVLGIAFYAIPGSIFTSSLLDKLEEKRLEKREKSKER